MKKQYAEPEIDVIFLKNDDIIVTSNIDGSDGTDNGMAEQSLLQKNRIFQKTYIIR